MLIQRGEAVRVWFDDGMHGTWVHGDVIAAGPKTYTVRWESGLRNRLKQGDHRVGVVPSLLPEGSPQANHHSPFASLGVGG